MKQSCDEFYYIIERIKILADGFSNEKAQLTLACDRYCQSLAFYLPQLSSVPRISMDTIIKHRLDIEAIEYYLRFKKPKNALTLRFKVISYIIESQGKHSHLFYLRKNSFFTAVSCLSFYTLRASWLLLKGAYLVWRYHLV